MIRLLDGEPVEYDGVLWIVKGYQHPVGYLVAYPRYSLVYNDKLPQHLAHKYAMDVLSYWDCIKQYLPLVPIGEAKTYRGYVDRRAYAMKRVIGDFIRTDRVAITGSSLIGWGRDIDIVVYGYDDSLIDTLYRLRSMGILRKPSIGTLYMEYYRKHRGVLSFIDYYRLKKDSILHGVFNGTPYSIRITLYEKGYHGCIDMVYRRGSFSGVLQIKDVIAKYTTPSRYLVEDREGGEYVLETYRILYSELEDHGRYYVEGVIEERRDGYYIIPDHGYMKPLN